MSTQGNGPSVAQFPSRARIEVLRDARSGRQRRAQS